MRAVVRGFSPPGWKPRLYGRQDARRYTNRHFRHSIETYRNRALEVISPHDRRESY